MASSPPSAFYRPTATSGPSEGSRLASDGHDAFLADDGFSSVEWERYWLEKYGALGAATPEVSARRAWPEKARRWATGN
jgi:hypothetical protein